MNTHSSGYYSIDKDYNILSYNDTTKQLYPNLQPGVKCYKALMGLDSPCPPCPVALGIQGPKTYLDPIRHIYETVDAVETVHSDGSRGHAVVESEIRHQMLLKEALDTAERANAEKSNFLSRMSHDMRTPLNGIIGLLDMSKIEEDGLVLNHEPFDLIRYEKETQMLIDMQAQKNGINFTVHIAPEIYEHPFVYGSPLHLRRAMMNIYSNCIKYNREKGTIHTEINALPSHDHKLVCRWTISDTGIGISREYLEKILEPFTQENVDARSVYHGT